MDPLAPRVARRFLAKTMDKEWLMAVRRGWLHLLAAMKPGSKERENEVFRQIRTFIQNFEEQLRFIYKPFRALLKMDPQGKRYQKALENLRTVVDQVEDQSYRKRQDVEWMNETYRKREDEIRRKYGLPEYGPMLTTEESEHLISTPDYNAALWKKYPELEEFGRQREHISDLWYAWMDTGFNEAKEKQLTPAFDRLLKVLYDDAREIKQLAESGQEMETEEVFTNFDLDGVKIIIDDRTVTPIQVKQYIKYLDETHQLMKAKGFGKMWYGRIFVKCEECGGKNPLGEGYGVGGDYTIGTEDIRIFDRPQPKIVRLVAHEMAHRYWYKHMSGKQRAKFEDLVKVRKPLNLPRLPTHEIENARHVIEETTRKFEHVLDTFEKDAARVADAHGSALITKYAKLFQDLVLQENHVYDAMRRVIQQHPAWDDHLKKEVEDYTGKEESAEVRLRRFFVSDAFLKEMKEYHDAYGDYGVGIKEWLRDARVYVRRHETAATAYLDKIEELLKGAFDPEDPRSILPVTDYGGSNISEAFAEVVSYFVDGRDMTRDQLESMRSVLASDFLLIGPALREEPCAPPYSYSRPLPSSAAPRP
jgi:hypothetical protein